MKKSLAAALLFIALSPLIAKADYSIVSQTNAPDASTASIPTAQVIQGLGLIPSSTITGMQLYFSCGSSGSAIGRISEYSNSTYSILVNTFTSTSSTLPSGDNIVSFDFTGSPVVVNTSNYYSIGVQSFTGCSSPKLKGSSTDVYVDDTTTYKCFNGACSPVKDLYFNMTASGTEPDTITITSPVNATSTVDFGLFQGDFTTPSTSSPRFVQVNYGYTSSTMTFHDAEPHTITNGGSEAWVVQKLNQLQTGTIYAQASLYDLAGTGFSATSTIISFTLTTSGNPYFPTLPNSTSTLADTTVSCDPDSGFFANGICNIIVWAFIPPQSAFDKFSNLKDAIGTKPPFGYFTALNAALTGLSSTTTSTVSFGDFTGISFFADIKSFLTWPLWFIFGWWVFNKFRHFKF